MISSHKGNVLLYVVVLMLIFGVLGVVMVSLFTTTTASTVTRNDTRRAIYMAESGMRYAFSEIRKADFDQDFMIDTLNTTTYTVTDAGTFTINVFSPWFEADGSTSNSGAGSLPLAVPIGTVPVGYTIPLPPNSIYAVNYEFTGFNPPEGGRAVISGYTIPNRPPPPDTLTLNLNDDFYANSDERIALAVQPATGQDIDTDGVNLDLPLEAQFFLPKFGGAISLRRNDYFYEERKEEPLGSPTKVVLTNLSKAPQSEWLTTQTDANDWVIMSPRNYLVVPTGTSHDTSYGGDYLFGKGIYDASLIRPVSAPPDITADDLTSNLSEQESDSLFFSVDTGADSLRIGRGLSAEFGSAFFDADMIIGGNQDYCQQGACLTELGVRVFFLLNFDQQGDGITFTLLGKGFPAPLTPNNSASSAGGDVELSELMGFAGDSRLNAAGSVFLATNPDDRGLDPPKIAVEFDTRTNAPDFNFCSAGNLNPDTRNDPLENNQDAVQYVFWGNEALDLTCRSGVDNATYDDNRHNTEDWQFDLNNDVRSTPTVGPDGTIYVGSNDNHLYAIDPAARSQGLFFPQADEWAYATGGDVISSPIVGADGTIYVGSNDNFFYALNPNGTLKWRFNTGADVRPSPAIGPDGTIYVGNDAGNLYAFDPAAPLPPKWVYDAFGDTVSLGRPAIGSDSTVYVSSYIVATDVGRLEAINPDTGLQIWEFDIGDASLWSPGINPDTDTLYIDRSGNRIVAVLSTGVQEWDFEMGADVDSTPAVGPDGTVYFGTDDDDFNDYWLYAVTSGGVQKWRFETGDEVDSSPALSSDGSIVYFVSNDNNLYAVNAADGAELWRFPVPTPNGDTEEPISSPIVGPDGTVYVGSIDNNLYAIGRPAEPRNIRDKLITSANLDSSVSVDSAIDWLNGSGSAGSWAVRLEVNRSLVPNVEGKFDYDLRLWMRQCPDSDDTPCEDIMGTFFQDTRIEYDYTAVADLPMRQQFSLSGADQDAFERFFFGFTGAAGAQALDATITQFQLSFIRPGDPVVTDDSTNWLP